MFKKYRMKSYNYRLLCLMLLCSFYGIIIINSVKPAYTVRQVFGLAAAVVVMTLLSFIDYNWILKYYWVIYFGQIALLLATRLFGYASHGAKRWIRLGPINLQASEFGKIILILFAVKILSMYKEIIDTWGFISVLWILLFVPLFLTLRQPDLSQTILTTSILFILIFYAGVSYKKIGLVILIVVPTVLGLLLYVQNPNQKLLKKYQRDRVMAFLQPEDNDDGAYQQKYAVQAIGSGELTGKGLNNDDPSSLLNSGYIAEAQTDFIFAAMGEQLGFVGNITAVLLLAAIVAECFWTSHKARDFTGRLIAMGVGVYIGLQTFINIGVVVQLLPNTGLALPFFSYGISSLMSLYIAMGIVLNVSLQRRIDQNIYTADFKDVRSIENL